MRKGSTKVLAALCASFPKKAIVDALMDMKPLARGELERLVDHLKQVPTEVGTTARRRRSATTQQRSNGTPGARIKRLPTAEAGLSQRQSIEELRSELSKGPDILIPVSRGASLDRWLDLVMTSVPAGEVLNAAMSIAVRHRPD